MTRWHDTEVKFDPRKHPVKVEMGAQYRFVPLHPLVAPAPLQLLPAKHHVSHAVPVSGGLSGILQFKLRAETPVLFGGVTRSVGKTPITEHTRLYDNGPYAASGRAIKGLIRSVYGIVTFSRFKPINGDHRFASRNMELLNLKQVSQSRAGTALIAGWLRPELSADGLSWRIYRLPGAGQALPSIEVVASLKSREIQGWLSGSQKKNLGAFRTKGDLLANQEKDKKTVKNLLVAAWHQALAKEKRDQTAERDPHTLLSHSRQAYYNLQRAALIPDIAKDLAVWFMLDIKKRTALIDRHITQASYREWQDRGLCGPERSLYLVTAGKFAKRENETLFDLPPADGSGFDPVNPVAMNAFLFNNSDYARTGADYPMGGRRTPKGNFDLYLRSYLLGLFNTGKRALSEELARRLGLVPEEAGYQPQSWSDVRNDTPPGIPVYCYGDPAHESFEMGTSKMVPKQPAGDVQSFLPSGHRDFPEDRLDWADALFGMVDDEESDAGRITALKSRLFFDFAPVEPERPDGPVEMLDENKAYPVLQGQPKASYDPFYLRRIDGREATPTVWASKDNAEVSGYKRYPAVADGNAGQLGEPVLIASSQISEMHSLVRPLNKGLDYDCRIEFHNLHPLELGGLLFAVTFGDTTVFEETSSSVYRHVGGRLRNLGFGRLRVHSARLINRQQVTAANPLSQTSERHYPAVLMRAFEIAMGQFASGDKSEDAAAQRDAFYNNRSIRALLNISRQDWPGPPLQAAGDISRQPGGMFHLPTNSNALFNSFANLRKLVYAGKLVPETGSVLDEFLQPDVTPPPCDEQILTLARAINALPRAN